MKTMKSSVVTMGIAIGLVVIGAFFSNLFHSNFGTVDITDISFVTEDGAQMRALLYVPKTANVDHPSPAVIAAHGFNNTLEVQDINAVELSRRGYIVLAIDDYDHGRSTFPDPRINKGIAADMGSYAALQYLGTLPYVDKQRIGMVGHSMGSSTIQFGTLRAFANHEKNPAVIVPKSVLMTEHTFLTNADSSALLYGKYPVAVGDLFGVYDEWSENMWVTVKRGREINMSKKAFAGMGFSGAEYNTYYLFGDSKKLTKDEAIQAANSSKPLRVMYQEPISHTQAHSTSLAASRVIEFFNVTLLSGKDPAPVADSIWFYKQLSSLVTMVGFFLFIVPFTFVMLEIPYFKAIIQPEPVAPSIVKTTKDKIVYWAIYLVYLLPAPLLYNWAVGYPIGIKSMNRYVPTVMPVTDYFQLPAVNGVVLLNLILGAIMLAGFLATYLFIMKGNGVTFDNLGLKQSWGNLGKSVLLALIVFIASYSLLVLIDFFFLADARFWVFSFKTLTPIKFYILLKYLPFFLFFYGVNSLLLNSFTRMRGQSETVNITLMIVANVAGLAVMNILDYVWLYTTELKLFLYVPYPPNTTSALAGVLCWNLMLILPLAAVSARLMYRKTGSIWVGAFVNALIITLFAISNTVSAAGVL